MFTFTNLQLSLAHLGVELTDRLFEQLQQAYQTPDRHYHNNHHIVDCLTTFQKFRHLATEPSAVEIAIWFHDAIYDSRASDNEERSAQWAQDYLQSVGAGPKMIAQIVQMILATKTHQALDPNSQILVDIDLTILSASPEVFEAYDRAIRREYAWVPKSDYQPKRRQVLQGFLDRQAIYHQPEIRQVYEAQARKNIITKLQTTQ
jgi:predicted metal-dependent HD superfamily phosphohydrolase